MTDRISEIRASLANVAYSGRYYPGDVEADIAYLLDRVEALEKAGGALVAKMDEVIAHPAWVGAFGLSLVHGAEYDGPTFDGELSALRRALTTEAR
jgi:hypothetical protein